MRQLFISPHITVNLHEGSPAALEIIWHGFVNSQHLRESLLEALRLARQHRITRWIADNTLIRALRPADIEWIAADVILPLNQLGVTRMAVVESQDAINRLGINSMLTSTIPQTTIEARYFPTLEQARIWGTEQAG